MQRAAGGYGGWGAYTHGYLPAVDNCPSAFAECTPGCPPGSLASQALLAQPSHSLFTAMHLIDFVWPQFYPSPVEITMNGGCWVYDLLAWTAIAHHAAAVNRSANRCRIGIGVPFSASAAAEANSRRSLNLHPHPHPQPLGSQPSALSPQPSALNPQP